MLAHSLRALLHLLLTQQTLVALLHVRQLASVRSLLPLHLLVLVMVCLQTRAGLDLALLCGGAVCVCVVS